jgi:hypothetical protein
VHESGGARLEIGAEALPLGLEGGLEEKGVIQGF